MKLDLYLSENNITQASFAKAIGVEQAAVNRWVLRMRVPRAEVMQRIFDKTGGAVTPNDFYDIGGNA